MSRAEGASRWREQRVLYSFRPAALYSADSQAWCGGGEYAQAAGIDSSELRSVRGGHGTTIGAHCGNRDSSHRQTVTGFIEVSVGSDVGTNIPVAVIRGPKPGPTLALVAGAHGTEYPSIIALEKLIQELNPAAMSGTVIIVPLVNIASFEQKVPHVNPVDGKSMNRFYPGNPNGTQTERASWAMTKQVVEKFRLPD